METETPPPRVMKFVRTSTDGLWRATAETERGTITASGISLHHARLALAERIREISTRDADRGDTGRS